LDIEKLRLFKTLADLKHFHRAAERSHVSPSKLSRVLQAIEAEVGARLLDRDNRSVSLTAQGVLFLQHARAMIQQWETLQDQLLIAKDSLSGSISIYCSVTASYSFLYDMLTDFRRLHPDIQIKLHTGDPAEALERVQSGREDIAIAARPERLPSELSFKSFAQSPLIFITPSEGHRFEQIAEQYPADFWHKIPLIISERGVAREQLDDWFRKNQITPNIHAQVAGHEALVSMVSLGFGVGLVPRIAMDNSPLKDRVRPFRYQAKLKPYDVGVCVLEKRLKSPVVEAFWSQI
jgi:transcriptional regulator, LysR family